MVYAITLYEVLAADVCSFTHAFCWSGEWHRLHDGLPGYVHFDLLVHSGSPNKFMLLEFWQSAADCDRAQQCSKLRAFSLSLRTIAVSHASLGIFGFRPRNEWTDVLQSVTQQPVKAPILNAQQGNIFAGSL